MTKPTTPRPGNKRSQIMKAYWFEPAEGVLGYGDGRRPEVGKTHTVKCSPVLCNSGLHGSVRAVDALRYAQSSRLWLVDITAGVVVGDDKICGKRRKYIAVADVELVLREHARWCALQVVHLWDAPQVMLEYLNTGDEGLRAAAWAAARYAAGDAARYAARAAARYAARYAAGDAARYAARAAAWAAARYAAGDAARNAAGDAAGHAAGHAARDKYNTRLEQILTKMFI